MGARHILNAGTASEWGYMAFQLSQIEPKIGTNAGVPLVGNPSKILGGSVQQQGVDEKGPCPGVLNFFLKSPSCLQAHDKPIVVDPDRGAVIPEPETCAVISKQAKHIRGA